jgi:hypothetical protein
MAVDAYVFQITFARLQYSEIECSSFWCRLCQCLITAKMQSLPSETYCGSTCMAIFFK